MTDEDEGDDVVADVDVSEEVHGDGHSEASDEEEEDCRDLLRAQRPQAQAPGRIRGPRAGTSRPPRYVTVEAVDPELEVEADVTGRQSNSCPASSLASCSSCCPWTWKT